MSRFKRIGLIGVLALLVVGCAAGPAATPIVIYVTPPPTPLIIYVTAPPAPVTPAETSIPPASLMATPTSAPRSMPSSAPTANAPAGYKLVDTDDFTVAIPSSWTTTVNASDQTLLDAQSPSGSTQFHVYRASLGGQTLAQYFHDQNKQIGGLWQTKIVESKATVDGVPALRGDALQTFLATTTHVSFDVERPVGSGQVYEFALDTDGVTSDPAFDTVMDSFSFK